MTPEPEIVDATLKRIERASEYPSTLAAKAVAEFRGRQTAQTVPWVNQRDTGSPLLDRDAILRSSEPNHAPKVEIKRRRRWWGR